MNSLRAKSNLKVSVSAKKIAFVLASNGFFAVAKQRWKYLRFEASVANTWFMRLHLSPQMQIHFSFLKFTEMSPQMFWWYWSSAPASQVFFLFERCCERISPVGTGIDIHLPWFYFKFHVYKTSKTTGQNFDIAPLCCSKWLKEKLRDVWFFFIQETSSINAVNHVTK